MPFSSGDIFFLAFFIADPLFLALSKSRLIKNLPFEDEGLLEMLRFSLCLATLFLILSLLFCKLVLESSSVR